MPDGNVTALFGDEIVTAGPPENVIDFLAQLLDRAKAGDITSIAVAYVRGNGMPCEGWEKGPNVADAFILHSAIACLFGMYTEQLNGAGHDLILPPDGEPA